MFDGRFLDMLLDGDASGMTILNDLDGSGSSPLVLAVRAENVEAVKVLIDRGAKVVLETVRSLAPTPPASVVLPAVWGGWLTAGARPLLLCVVCCVVRYWRRAGVLAGGVRCLAPTPRRAELWAVSPRHEPDGRAAAAEPHQADDPGCTQYWKPRVPCGLLE